MFESLSDNLTSVVKNLKGQGRITEKNIEQAVKEVRLHLLEADVNFKVVKTFIERVKEKALGQDVVSSVSPGEQFVQVVHEELKILLGKEVSELNLREKPSIIYLVGLQGAGKTTSSAKLALHIRKKLNKKPGLVPADVYRPAAKDQLKTLAKQNDLPCFDSEGINDPEEIVKKAQDWAKDNMIEVLLIDTAGRLQVDEDLMAELSRLKLVAKPQEILLVADAMLGQQALNVAEAFHKEIDLSGLILTKIDGDARGGAALSIRESTGIPIKFIGSGEKASDLEIFYPERLASRILDMGDVLSLVERAQEVVDEKEAEKTAKKMARNQFTLEDFLQQIQQMKKMGGMASIMKMLPGMGQLKKQMKNMAPPDEEIKKIEAIIRSMTPLEREKPNVLNGSRRARIARGSGTEVKDINKFMKQFEQMKKMMGQMMKSGFGGGGLPGMGGGGGLPGMGKGKGPFPF